jgi:hypothetical protein
MSVMYELEKIRELIKQPCNMARTVPFMVNNYTDVLKQWSCYNKGEAINDKKLCDIFNFHNNNIDHILLYWSSNQEDCLLMCKISNKYINLRIPMMLDDVEKSFIATYT